MTGNGIPEGPAAGDAGALDLGVVIKPHGLKGEVKVRAYSRDLKAFCRYPWFDTPRGRMNVARALVHGDVVRVQFEGVGSVEAAESLRGLPLARPRAAVDKKGLLVDYLGRRVRLDGAADAALTVGRIAEYFEAPQSGLFQVVFDEGFERLVPSTLEYWRPLEGDEPAVLVDPRAEWSRPL